MAQRLNTDKRDSPAARAMDEAIELAIQGELPYPDKAAFIDADEPSAGIAIKRAVDEGRTVVLAYADGTTRVLHPAADGVGS